MESLSTRDLRNVKPVRQILQDLICARYDNLLRESHNFVLDFSLLRSDFLGESQERNQFLSDGSGFRKMIEIEPVIQMLMDANFTTIKLLDDVRHVSRYVIEIDSLLRDRNCSRTSSRTFNLLLV